MTRRDLELLNNLRIRRDAILPHVSEQYRQKLIAWGMREPPLVIVEGEHVLISAAGEDELRRAGLMPCEANPQRSPI